MIMKWLSVTECTEYFLVNPEFSLQFRRITQDFEVSLVESKEDVYKDTGWMQMMLSCNNLRKRYKSIILGTVVFFIHNS